MPVEIVRSVPESVKAFRRDAACLYPAGQADYKPVMPRYWAFISYSHKDEAWARWLQHSIETYRVPRALVKRGVSGRLIPVFRDRDELPGAANLSHTIQAALDESRALVVLCSPHSARSRHVDQEIRAFGRRERVLSLIVDGEPPEVFPPALTEGGEPIAADVRPGRDGKAMALLKILAGLIGIGLDELVRRERRRQRMRRIRKVGIVLAVMLLYLAMADGGLRVPGGDSLRRMFDRYGVTLFRPVHTDAEIASTAAALCRTMVADLLANQADTGLFYTEMGRKGGTDTWTSAQAMAALGRTGQPPPRSGFDGLFAGLKEGGWPQRLHAPPQGAITMWAASALALYRDDRLAECRTLMQHHALPDGGWAMFASRKDKLQWDYYTGTLALQALLNDPEPDAARIRATSEAMIRGFDGIGWRRAPGDGLTDTYDGMALQLYAQLLRAEDSFGVTIPEALLRHMTAHLITCGQRNKDFPVTKAEFNYFLEDGEANEAVGFLWYPWAIESAARWLHRAQSLGAAPEDIVGVRRTLGYLVVDLGPPAVEEIRTGPTFGVAEMLYCLSAVQ